VPDAPKPSEAEQLRELKLIASALLERARRIRKRLHEMRGK